MEIKADTRGNKRKSYSRRDLESRKTDILARWKHRFLTRQIDDVSRDSQIARARGGESPLFSSRMTELINAPCATVRHRLMQICHVDFIELCDSGHLRSRMPGYGTRESTLFLRLIIIDSVQDNEKIRDEMYRGFGGGTMNSVRMLFFDIFSISFLSVVEKSVIIFDKRIFLNCLFYHVF